jgi:type VI secretion system secreted protein Hcp
MKAIILSALIGALSSMLPLVGVGQTQTTSIAMFVDGLPGDEGGSGDAAGLLAFAHAMTVPTDPSSGSPLGPRRHQPVSVMKRVNPGTPAFASAVATGRVLTSVRFDFYRIDRSGLEELYFRVWLENARLAVSRIEKMFPTPDNERIANTPVEFLDFLYERIRWEYLDGGVEFEDDWGLARKTASNVRGDHAGLGTRLTEASLVEVTTNRGEHAATFEGRDVGFATIGEAMMSLAPGSYAFRVETGGMEFDSRAVIPSGVPGPR